MNKKGKIFAFKYFLLDLARITGWLPGLIWWRFKRYYVSKQAKKHIRGAALVISNHGSFVDPVFIFYAVWYRRVHIVAASDMFKSNILFKHCNCIPVDRDNPGLKFFRDVKAVLDDNRVVAMFPEGHIHREEGEAVKSIKDGAALIALRSGCPVIPMYIVYRKKWYQRMKFVFGEPIDVEKIASSEMSNSRKVKAITGEIAAAEDRLKLFYEDKGWKKKKV